MLIGTLHEALQSIIDTFRMILTRVYVLIPIAIVARLRQSTVTVLPASREFGG